MRLYLVQHGEAQQKAKDPKRRLTTEGRESVTRMAALAKAAGVKVHQIRHSGKRRAKETAVILAEHLNPPDGIVALPGLAPKDNVTRVAELLNREDRSLLFVGHRPFMDRLVGRLVAGDSDRPVVRFEKGGIVCLERDRRAWTWVVQWAVTPDVIP